MVYSNSNPISSGGATTVTLPSAATVPVTWLVNSTVVPGVICPGVPLSAMSPPPKLITVAAG
jgi:hypothetical protein